jgi:hypothetical protein
MREIKFRAWSNHEQVMYHSVGFTDSDCGRSVRAEEYMVGGGELVLDPVLMQFTGMKDAKGKEIYEGDVLRKTGFSPFEIKWRRDGFDLWQYSHDRLDPAEAGFEVIGNIYENPELMQK